MQLLKLRLISEGAVSPGVTTEAGGILSCLSGSFSHPHQVWNRSTSQGTCCLKGTSSLATEESQKAYLQISTKRSLLLFLYLIDAGYSL